jgi:pyruvate-ferredoxin/flavodoxin oxidoreductase
MGEHADAWSADGRAEPLGRCPRWWRCSPRAAPRGRARRAASRRAHHDLHGLAGPAAHAARPVQDRRGADALLLHVAARTVATHALSIFGDHSDVMAARSTGPGPARLGIGAGGPRPRRRRPRRHPRAPRARAALLRRVSHLARDHPRRPSSTTTLLRARGPLATVSAHRARALDPDRPVVRGTSQNPDVISSPARPSNPSTRASRGRRRHLDGRFAALTGRRYRLFDYAGHPEAERVVVLMGSGAECAHETVEHLAARGERVGVVKVRLYRPFSVAPGRRAAARRCARSRCSTARRSPAPRPIRCTRRCSRPSPTPSPRARSTPCRGCSAGATGSRRRSSPRRW